MLMQLSGCMYTAYYGAAADDYYCWTGLLGDNKWTYLAQYLSRKPL